MALAEALRVIVGDWNRRRTKLPPERLARLRETLALAALAPQRPGRFAVDLLQIAALHDEDPVWTALEKQRSRSLRGGEWQVARSLLDLRFAAELSLPEPSPQQVDEAAQLRLAVNPLVAVEPPFTPQMLVLQVAGGAFAPAFQFAEPGRGLVPAVALVNEILDARDDPWAAASWWLSPHSALHALPADLLRFGEEARVVAAAQALAF